MIEPLIKPRPSVDPAPAEVPCAYAWNDVIEELRFNASWTTDQQAAGLLVGHHYRDPDTNQSYVEIDGFVAATHVPDGSTFSRYLRQEWRSISATVREHFGEAEVVGWFLASPKESSPGQSEFVMHNSFFSHSWQVGLWLSAGEAPNILRTDGGRFLQHPLAVLQAPATS